MNNQPPNQLDEALSVEADGAGPKAVSSKFRRGQVVAIEDCVETSGSFVLHHLIKRALSPLSSDVVLFLAFAHPFSHYDRVLRKMGCNLVVQADNKRFLFFDMLRLESADGSEFTEDGFLSLYGKIQRAVELCSSPENNRNITVMIDDVSLIEVAAKGLSNEVLNFLHYCYSLTTQFSCSFITLNHHDIYSSEDKPSLILQMEYLADVVIKAEPLATGLATDVHGQLTVLNKGSCNGLGSSRIKCRNFHFRIKESNVEYFYPGTRT